MKICIKTLCRVVLSPLDANLFKATMKSLIKIVAIFLVGAALCLDEVSALDNLKCRGLPVTVTEAQINNIKACAASLGIVNPEKPQPDKIGCYSKCILEKKELMDDQGKPHKENINKIIDATMPEPTRADAKTKFSACLDKHGDGDKIDVKDPSCVGYVPLAMCTHTAMIEVCKG